MPHETTRASQDLDHGPASQVAAQKKTKAPADGQAPTTGVRTDRDPETIQRGHDGDCELPTKAKSYFVETDDGIFRITVPADWLITFGPMYVSTRTKGNERMQSQSNYGIPTALRFYEGKHQRACMLNVTNFYDLDIQIESMNLADHGKNVIPVNDVNDPYFNIWHRRAHGKER